MVLILGLIRKDTPCNQLLFLLFIACGNKSSLTVVATND